MTAEAGELEQDQLESEPVADGAEAVRAEEDADPHEADAPRLPSTPSRTSIHVLIGAAIGLVMALVVFDRSFFFGDEAQVLGIQGDAGSSFAGFRAFIADSWHFPLLETDNLTNRGEPTVIALTDSLPLLGLTAKALGFLGIAANTWIAIWYYGNIVLQGAAAGLAARTHRVSSYWSTGAIAVMAVSAPAMFMRVWHPGLYGHFTLVLLWAAIGHFWRHHTLRSALWMIPIVILSLLVHPYFLVMTAAVAIGVVLAAASTTSLSVPNSVIWLVALPGTLIPTMYVLGYLPSEAVAPGGYGAFAMPVVSPFWPQWSGLWPGDEWILLNKNQSFEGINYLGGGAVIAAVTALAVSWRRLRDFAVRQQVLLVVCFLLTMVAISHKVYFVSQTPFVPFGEEFSALNTRQTTPTLIVLGMVVAGFALFVWSWRSSRGHVIRPATTALAVTGLVAVAVTAVERGFIWDQLQQFRAAGRFFWVIGTAISLGAIVLIDRRLSTEVRAQRVPAFVLPVVMVLLAGLQIADTGRYRDFVPGMFLSTPERVELIETFATIAEAHDEVRIAPDWFCTLEVNEALTEFQDMVIAATSVDVVIDGYYGGRTETDTSCPETAEAPGGGVLTVVVRPLHFGEFIDIEPGVECRYSQHMAICSSRWSDIDPAITQRFAQVPLPWPPT